MKNFTKYMLIAFAACLTMTACESEDDFQCGPEDSETKAGAYFEVLSDNLELEPTEATVASIYVSRHNTKGTLSLPINVVENQDNVFSVPATVEFADGEKMAEISISFDKAEIGNPYTLTLDIPQDYISYYNECPGYLSHSFTVSRVKWESIGTCYWVDGIVSTWYGVITGPFAVQVDKAETPSATKYRFASPYAHFNPNMDEAGIGYLGYPYSDVEYDEEDHLMIITVTGKSASLAPVQLGATFGADGMINTGSILGYLSNNTSSYVNGSISSDGTKIEFPANSLYVNEPGYGTGVCSKPSILYLDPKELMIPDPYQPIGYGFYGYEQFFGWPEADPDYCYLELCQNTEDSSLYRIDGWDLINGGSFFFSKDENDVITFDEQYTGYTDEDLGDINVSNFVETKNYFDWDSYQQVTEIVSQSHYDAEKNTYFFNMNYACEAGSVAIGYETFEMIEMYDEEEADESKARQARGRSLRNKSAKTLKPTGLRHALKTEQK